jgi:hypothetical protein
MGVLDLRTGNQIELSQKITFRGMSWFADGKNILWANDEGVFKINVETRNNSLIKKSCSVKGYGSPALSPDNNTIILGRQDKKKIDDHTMYQETNLYLMNADGSNERKIEF